MTQKQSFIHNNTTYYYWTEGNPKNPLLLLIPGFTGTHGDLLDLARQFKNKYFVILPDLPGWGESPKNGYHLTINGYAVFLQDLLQAQEESRKIFLAGHCMGSNIAIEFSYQFPVKVKQLFLIGVPYLEGRLSDAFFQHLAKDSKKVPKIIRPLFYFFRSRFFAIPSGFFVIQTRSLRKKLSIILKNSVKQQFQDEDLVEKNWDSLALFNYKKLEKITVPIHIFHGQKDLLVPPQQAEKLAAITHGATVDYIPHAGHMPPVETPGTLAHAMQKYL